ncbi:DUF3284 domain-containing protein [Lactobacillus johnsonii]|uniref:DUF3284 domain-containing protein n=1 Tax=Lactobacillus johnsonii (strain FI9785) TaxID=633699 RepID=D0R1T3_LACJF|nr:DUF3284 domain-containing protein [Lactobacillus johnsonii]CAX66148.1 hypothetical protein predicted by Glimmer/Critica [Lactobacillus johnsonii FI9785]
MITIKEQADFKAKDFFNYLNRQLTQEIKKSRSNDLPVKIAAGTTYQQRNVKAEITEYEFGKKYVSVFKSPKIDVKIEYCLTDTPQGCQIVFKEDVLSYDEKKHSNIGTWFYNWQLKQGAKKQLKQMKNNVLAYTK